MRKLLCLVMLILIVNIWADFSGVVEIDNSAPISFAGEEAILIDGEAIYFTFASEGMVKVAKSLDNGLSFEYTTLETIDPISKLPVISRNSLGDIFVFFEHDGLLQKAISSNDGSTYQISVASDFPNHIYSSNQFTNTVSNLQTKFISQHYNQFQYFTDTEASINADGGNEAAAVKFWGPDVLQGAVHSNSDIWIQHAGGGNNGGWPTFHSPITSSGELRMYPSGEPLVGSGVPINDVILDLFEENMAHIPYNANLEDIRENGEAILPANAEVAVIHLEGNNYSGFAGEVVLTEIRQLPVYSWFPSDAEQVNEVIAAGGNWFEDTEIIGINEVAIYDTIWSPISGSVNGNSVFVEGDLYIYGNVSGRQTWGCSGEAYLIDDITYSNTIVGEHPDGFIGYDINNEAEYDENAINQTDYFALASENSIKIAYKFRMDIEGESIMYDNNVDGIYLYGYYMAAGKGDVEEYGDMACHYDGVFTFDYQHPHGSTPNFVASSPYTGNDTLYSYVDLHKYVWPPDSFAPEEYQGFNLQSDGTLGEGSGMAYPNSMCGFPYGSSQDPDEYAASYPNIGPDYVYPDGTDVPLYNPVWPESATDAENAFYYGGKMAKVFGSIIQRRRGFMRRSGADPYNHQVSGFTGPEEFQYGGTHPATGYDKEYYYDNRFLDIVFPDMPTISDDLYEMVKFVNYPTEGLGPDKSYLSYNLDNYVNILSTQTNSQLYYLLQGEIDDEVQSILVQVNTDDSYEVIDQFNDLGLAASFHKIGDFYFLAKDAFDPTSDLYKLVKYPLGGTLEEIVEISGSGIVATSELVDDDQIIISSDDANLVNIYRNFIDDSFASIYNWQSPFTTDLEQIAVEFADDKLHIFVKEFGAEPNQPAPVYYVQGDWEGILPVCEEETPELQYSLSNYPNPFNPSTTIKFSTTESTENTEIVVYNMKGQKVKTLVNEALAAGEHEVSWNGTDTSGKPVASGVYMYRLQADGHAVKSKKMILIK